MNMLGIAICQAGLLGILSEKRCLKFECWSFVDMGGCTEVWPKFIFNFLVPIDSSWHALARQELSIGTKTTKINFGYTSVLPGNVNRLKSVAIFTAELSGASAIDISTEQTRNGWNLMSKKQIWRLKASYTSKFKCSSLNLSRKLPQSLKP